MATSIVSALLWLSWLTCKGFILGIGAFGGLHGLLGMLTGLAGLIIPIVEVAVQAFIFYAALQMRSMERYVICCVGAGLAVVPCLGCCFLNVPAGIWCLVVLLSQDVKTAFQS